MEPLHPDSDFRTSPLSNGSHP